MKRYIRIGDISPNLDMRYVCYSCRNLVQFCKEDCPRINRVLSTRYENDSPWMKNNRDVFLGLLRYSNEEEIVTTKRWIIPVEDILLNE
jgi:hypothetical protein